MFSSAPSHPFPSISAQGHLWVLLLGTVVRACHLVAEGRVTGRLTKSGFGHILFEIGSCLPLFFSYLYCPQPHCCTSCTLFSHLVPKAGCFSLGSPTFQAQMGDTAKAACLPGSVGVKWMIRRAVQGLGGLRAFHECSSSVIRCAARPQPSG